MPALRKSARAPPHSRSSTTPYASPTGTPSDSAGGKRQSLMTEWTEPAPQNLAPSFEEHGFARHGVLETMAPLGVPPSAKVKQKTRAMGETAARNAAFGKGSAVYGDGIESTPEVTPAPELEAEDSERQEEDMMQVDFPLHEEEEDDDYEPTKTKKKGKVSKTPVRGKTPVQGRTPVHGKTPIKNGTSKSASVSASPAVQAVQPIEFPPALQTETGQRIQTAVNDAILRANKAERRQIGIALKELWEESERDHSVADLIDAILHENYTDEQWQFFRSFIKASRKRQRNDAKWKRLQDENAGRRASGFFSASNRPSPRASSEVVPDDSASAAYDMADQELSNFSTSGAGSSATKNAHHALQTSIEQNSAVAPPHPFNAAPAIPADTHVEATPRMLSKSPRKKATTNGHLAPDAEMDLDGGLSTAVPTPAGKTPESGGGSDSELSEVNEEIVQKGPPEPVQGNGKATSAAAAAAAKKAKSAANARAAKKHKPNVGKLFGKHANKQHQPTPEQLLEDEKAYEVRKELVKQQPIRRPELNEFEISDVRFDDEINDTESLTESQIAVGPPVDSHQPRRAGRVPHYSAKRMREDGYRFSSPLAESAAGTRPSTPAVGPATKRLKLTHGSTARTKRSPVKNRDGPIAGVAYVNGGGSRQLGPDDNDPNSLSSESDDFCSACKGAGEFVCCETCPRVFHLLCCDPPRAEVPDDAFFCYECRPKGAAEESTDTHLNLGPLYKALERTNPRAFALPYDIQHEFEGISAKADGSYFEEVKKFPLTKHSGYGYQKPDYMKVLDAEGKPILCTQCGLSSGNKRQLLKCDFCPAHWHLDCLDPPLANPPHISIDSSQRDAWRCPRHIEHDLRSGQLYQNDLNDDVEMADAVPAIRVTRKIRKRKQPKIIEPTFSRGMRNNGLIELINDPDDDTDGEGNYVFGPDDPKDLNSKVFRVPEKGVILDFLSKVKSGRVAKHSDAHNAIVAAQHKATMQNFIARPMAQQQAALNLARFANKEKDIGLSEGKLDMLLLTLTAEADNDVTTALDDAGPPSVDENERAQLLKLQELITRRLKG